MLELDHEFPHAPVRKAAAIRIFPGTKG